MVMSGSSDDLVTILEKGEKLDSFQNRSKSLLRKGRHPGSNFRRCSYGADFTEGDFLT